MLKYIFTVLIVLILFNRDVNAQELIPAAGNVEVVQDIRITQLADKYHKMSLNNPETDGFRVQIFFDSGNNSKSSATNTQDEFNAVYPEIGSYLSYKEPYYRVRVGNFRTLVEAVGFQKKITPDYPNSFPVKDKIIQ